MARTTVRTRPLLAAAATAAAALVAGCGLGTAGGFAPSGTLAGPVADVSGLDGAEVAVGSKNFTEQILVGKMAVILLTSAGADVKDYTNIPGSSSARQAMLAGQLDMMWEYTGTAWIAYLGHSDPIPDEQKQYEAVAKEDLATNDLVWLKPAPMNNTYGFAVKAATAKKYDLKTLSDIAKVPKPQRTFCVESEFKNRNDGFQPMLETYGVPLGEAVPSNQVKTLDTGAIYAATDNGLCTFGEVFTTDGRIKALDLVVLDDNKRFFPLYNLSPVLRRTTLEAHPQLKDLFEPVAQRLTNEVLLTLNARVDVEGGDPARVAFDWLTDEGFIAKQ